MGCDKDQLQTTYKKADCQQDIITAAGGLTKRASGTLGDPFKRARTASRHPHAKRHRHH